jgi:hypothetical protein
MKKALTVAILALLASPAFGWQPDGPDIVFAESDDGRPMEFRCVRGTPRVAFSAPVPVAGFGRIHASPYPVSWSLDGGAERTDTWTLSGVRSEVFMYGPEARAFAVRIASGQRLVIGDTRLTQRYTYSLSGFSAVMAMLERCQ